MKSRLHLIQVVHYPPSSVLGLYPNLDVKYSHYKAAHLVPDDLLI